LCFDSKPLLYKYVRESNPAKYQSFVLKLADAHNANNDSDTAISTLEGLIAKPSQKDAKPEDVQRLQLDIYTKITRILQSRLENHKRQLRRAAQASPSASPATTPAAVKPNATTATKFDPLTANAKVWIEWHFVGLICDRLVKNQSNR
jgi:hypothetical protein